VSASPPPGGRAQVFSTPSGETIALTQAEVQYHAAVWQLEELGWIWDQGAGETKLAGAWNRSPLLRSNAIRMLARAWHDGRSQRTYAELVEEIGFAMRWFFPSEVLTKDKIAQAIRNK